MTRLRDLFPEEWPGRDDDATIEISGLAADSRLVKPGFLFFALPGTKMDGARFIADAEARGASAIAAPSGSVATRAPLIPVKDARRALALAAAAFYARQPAKLAAVTGTSGKTSVSAFTRQIWASLGEPAAAIGTTGVVAPGESVYGQLTTPDPVTLHRILDELAERGVTHAVLEASSHGLDQKRLDGIRLTAGAFTNLSRDHLDYHASLEDYFQAKLHLFNALLAPGQTAVVDVDNEAGRRVAEVCRQRGLRVIAIGRSGSDIKLLAYDADASGAMLTVDAFGKQRRLRLPLAGDFMASNALVAAGLCLATGSRDDDVFAALETLQGAPGRLERIGEHHGAPIFVDYAHKPDALEKVLRALRGVARKRLVAVFGCGGDRDPGKRPMMGEIATREADIVIVTDDNPRSESPDVIRAAILAAAPGALEIGDRREAIRRAISLLEPGDALVVAGKGHETGQIVGDQILPFSDQEEISKALKEVGS